MLKQYYKSLRYKQYLNHLFSKNFDDAFQTYKELKASFDSIEKPKEVWKVQRNYDTFFSKIQMKRLVMLSLSKSSASETRELLEDIYKINDIGEQRKFHLCFPQDFITSIFQRSLQRFDSQTLKALYETEILKDANNKISDEYVDEQNILNDSMFREFCSIAAKNGEFALVKNALLQRQSARFEKNNVLILMESSLAQNMDFVGFWKELDELLSRKHEQIELSHRDLKFFYTVFRSENYDESRREFGFADIKSGIEQLFSDVNSDLKNAETKKLFVLCTMEFLSEFKNLRLMNLSRLQKVLISIMNKEQFDFKIFEDPEFCRMFFEVLILSCKKYQFGIESSLEIFRYIEKHKDFSIDSFTMRSLIQIAFAPHQPVANIVILYLVYYFGRYGKWDYSIYNTLRSYMNNDKELSSKVSQLFEILEESEVNPEIIIDRLGISKDLELDRTFFDKKDQHELVGQNRMRTSAIIKMIENGGTQRS